MGVLGILSCSLSLLLLVQKVPSENHSLVMVQALQLSSVQNRRKPWIGSNYIFGMSSQVEKGGNVRGREPRRMTFKRANHQRNGNLSDSSLVVFGYVSPVWILQYLPPYTIQFKVATWLRFYNYVNNQCVRTIIPVHMIGGVSWEPKRRRGWTSLWALEAVLFLILIPITSPAGLTVWTVM